MTPLVGRARAIPAFVIVALAAAGFVWWRLPAKVMRGSCDGCNVLLITIDTLRVDRVGAFGGRSGLTPHLDQLASEGLRLTRAYSAAPLTLPSHASILTAVSPPVHGLRANGLFRLGPNLPTLGTVLKAGGYRTGAFVGAFVLDARFGLNRGFDVYDDRYGEKQTGDAAEDAERRAADVIAPASAWIIGTDRGLGTEGRGTRGLGSTEQGTTGSGAEGSPKSPGPQSPVPSPWFAWVHLYDPHEPYRAPAPYSSQHEPYDAEVAYTDAMVGKLLADLRAAGQLDRTLVMVAADHGESLGEHGERTHGVFVYDVTMRVPWVVWAGGRVPRHASDALVRLVDLAPTVLDLLGVGAPSTFEGRSILPAVNGGEAESPAAYIEAMDANLTRNWAPLVGLVTADYKLIDLPIPELYDLRSDPSETTNLFARDAGRARTLESLLLGTIAAFRSRASSAEKTVLTADSRQRLQALGYVASTADPAARAYTDKDDPKNLIEAANDLNRTIQVFETGRTRDAIEIVAGIIQAHPNFASAYAELANMRRRTGDLAGAVSALEEVVRRGMADQRVMVVLAGYLLEAGAAEKAALMLEAVIASHPDYAEAYNSLGVVEMRLGHHDRARAAFRKVLELDPTSAKAYENLAADELSAGERTAAAMDLQRALELDPRLYDALYNLGVVLHELGRRDEAQPYIERFIREAPRPRYATDIARLEALLKK